MYTSVETTPIDNENLNNLDGYIDFNSKNKINIFTKNFFDKTINNVLLKINQRTSLLKRASAQRVSVKTIILNEFETGFETIKIANKQPGEVTPILKRASAQRVSVNTIILDEFETGFKQIKITDKQSDEVTSHVSDVNEIRNENTSKEKNFYDKSNSINDENQCNNFTSTLNVENVNAANKNLDNKCNLFSRDFFNQKIRKTLGHIETQIKSQDFDNKDYNDNLFSKNFLNDKVRNTITKIDKENNNKNNLNNIVMNKKRSIITPTDGFINESLKRLSNKIDDKVEKKIQEEVETKSAIIEKKLLVEKLEVENEIEKSKINITSNNFWRKSCAETLQKYNVNHEKLVKYVIRIQKNFRRSLWKFIIKLEMMNLHIQKENERAIAASKKRKSANTVKQN
jgi:hypothetical protein